ncbi:MAG: serine hydrolase domain-containing protein [Pseudomonadota bacterium]
MGNGENPVCSLMERAVSEGVFPGGVLLVSFGPAVVLNLAVGRADIYTGQIMEPDFIFDLASMTKPLATAMAVMRLVDQGKLALDQAMGSILAPLSGTDKGGITVDQLLRHTSGLAAHREFYRIIKCPGTGAGRRELRCLLTREPLVQEPGTHEVYSDLGYMLLSWIVEEVSGQRLDFFVRQQVYQPLGIEDLFFIETGQGGGVPRERQRRLVATENCPWRQRVLRGEVHDDNAWAAGGIEGHAGLFGSAPAVWRLTREIREALDETGAGVIPGKVLEQCISRQRFGDKVAGFDTPSRTGSSSGRYLSPNSIGHLGFTGTSFWMDLDQGLTVILLTNRVHPSRSNEKIRLFRPVLHDAVATWLRDGQ